MALINEVDPSVVDVERYIPRGVIREIRNVDPSFDSGKLLEAVIHHFGGPEKFARAIVAEFHAAGPGTLTRQRILEMVNRLTMNVTSNSPPSRNASDMDDDELMAAAANAVNEIKRKVEARAQAAQDQGPAAPVGQPGAAPQEGAGEEGARPDRQAPPRGRGRPKRAPARRRD